MRVCAVSIFGMNTVDKVDNTGEYIKLFLIGLAAKTLAKIIKNTVKTSQSKRT